MKRTTWMLMAVAVLAFAGCGGRGRGASSSAGTTPEDPFSIPNEHPVSPDAGVPLGDGGYGVPTDGGDGRTDGGNGQNDGNDQSDGNDPNDGNSQNDWATIKLQGFDVGDFRCVPLCVDDVKVYAEGECIDVKQLQCEVDVAQCTLWKIAKFRIPQNADKVKIKIDLDPECGQAVDAQAYPMSGAAQPLEFWWPVDKLRQSNHLTVHLDVLKSIPPDNSGLLFLPNVIVRSGGLLEPNECDGNLPPPTWDAGAPE